jgi:glucose dehydrogenase
MAQSNLFFIGIAGTVLALDRATGEDVWRTELKGSDFVNVALQDGDLLATAKGELFCLDAATGQIRWRNKLKGMGTGLISIATTAGQTVLAREKKKRDDASASAAVIAAS